MKDDPQIPVHEHDPSVPTVIHHPEEDMTALARWLHRGIEQGPRFWLLLGGAVVALVAVFALAGSLSAARSAEGQAWIDLLPAKTTVDDRLKIADTYPNTEVAHWARLQAAAEEYQEGLYALLDPKQRDLVAGAKLRKALGYFKQVAAAAKKDSPMALSAALGTARTLEALNQLPEAIRQYQVVAETFKGTPEAKQAEAAARALEDPENATFYKELYAYKPQATPAPPGNTPGSIFDLTRPAGAGGGLGPDFINPNSNRSFLPNMPAPADLDAPPPATPPAPATPEKAAEKPAEPSTKPTDVPVIPPGEPATKPEPPK